VGLATLDIVHRVAAPPGENQKVTANAQFIAAGGPAANAAVTFAALGGEATLVTVLGRSPVAELIRRDLSACGVRVVDLGVELSDPPPISSISVTESTGDRSIVGGERALSLPAVAIDRRPLEELLPDQEVLLVDGHHSDIARVAAEAARAAGTPVVLDAGRWKPQMSGLMPLVTDVVASADFLLPTVVSSTQTAERLVESGVPTVVVTAGERAVRWWADAESGEVEVPRVVARDTLGAGDVFHGAYAYGLAAARDSTLPDRIAFASAVAAMRCEYVGPRGWLEAVASLASPGEEESREGAAS